MRRPLIPLEEPYRARALTPGSARWLSWLFAAPAARDPLLGIFALLAEWRALMDPATEAGVAQLKLAWWQDEIRRLRAHTPTHPITRFLQALPNAERTDFGPLSTAVEAALAYVAGAPVARASDLPRYAAALTGAPLGVASALGGGTDPVAVHACTTAISLGEYLAHAAVDYRREARHGRICFAVDELLAAGIEDADLVSEQASPRLRDFLQSVAGHAAEQLAAAPGALPAGVRSSERHLIVLAQAEQRQLLGKQESGGAWRRLQDLYAAWTAARRAAAGG